MHAGVRLAIAMWTVGLIVGGAAAASRPKVVIIAFDGADARLVEQWMDQGELPNLSRLREDGSYAPLRPTNPPQTPVSWSTFATGTDPGRTEVFDFIKRDPATGRPDWAMIEVGRRPYLFGERNGQFVGALAGVVVTTAAFIGLMAVRLRWPTRLAVGLLLGTALGAGAGWAASRYVPVEVPDVVNNRKGRTLWELAAEAGLRARVIRVPNTFPAERVDGGHMISGLGVPDMRGRIGTPAFFTSNQAFRPPSDFSLEFISLPARRGRIETRVVGPLNLPFFQFVIDRKTAGATSRSEYERASREVREDLERRRVPRRLDLPLHLDVSDTSVVIELGGESQTLHVGEWSGWFAPEFQVNPIVDVTDPLRGLLRFKLLALEPHLELYQSPINFHPDCHPIAFTWPPEDSERLRERFGLYKTIGWALDTWSLPSGIGGEELFLEDMRFTVAKFEEMMKGLLGDGEDDLYIQIFYFTDRIGHLFWRFLDTGHPLHDPVLAERYGGEMLAAYKKMDDLVGEARRLAGEDAVFIVCSDHGFSSYRRGVNYNNWLVDQGLMVLKNQGIDWSRTKAYAMGLGGIYVNLKGREVQGAVLPGAEYEKVRRQIREGLEALVDPVTGERPVARVFTREELYDEFDPDLIPDLRVSNNLNYRVSWQTNLGGFGEGLIEDNPKAWSGDHSSNDPDLVRGVFFVNRKINTTEPRMIDVMPTVLHALQLPVPPEVQGRSLF